MNTYIVTYDLHSKDKDYSTITNVLENVYNGTNILGSVWIIETLNRIDCVYDLLKKQARGEYSLIVAEISGFRATGDIIETIKQEN